MDKAEPKGLQRPVGERLVGRGDAREIPLRLFHRRHDDVAAAAAGELLLHEPPPAVEVVGAHAIRGHRLAARGRLVEHRHVEVAVDRVGDRPRNRRGRHHQRVRLGLPLLEHRPLEHAEAVLLVDHHEAEVLELGGSRDEGLRADDDSRGAGGDPGERRIPLLRRLAADEQFHLDAAAGEQPGERLVVLAGEQFRGRHDRRLESLGRVGRHPRADRGEHRVDRDRRLAAPHVPLEKAVHRLRPGHVGGDLPADPLLGGGECEGKPGADPGVEPGVDRDRRRRLRLLLPAAVHPQGQLEHEQLLVDEPPPCRVDHLTARRAVDLAKGPFDRQETLRGEHLLRDRLGADARGVIEGRSHRQPHVRLLHALRERVDGEPVGGMRLLATGKPADFRVGKLPDAAREPRLAGDHHLHPLGESLRHERHVEPHRPHPAGPAGKRHTEHGATGGERPRAGIDHLAGDRGVLPFAEVGEGMGAGEVAVFPREVHERVANRHQAELDELLGPRGPHPRQPLEAGGETRVTRHSAAAPCRPPRPGGRTPRFRCARSAPPRT